MDSNRESETMDLSFVTDLLVKEVQIPPLRQIPPSPLTPIAPHPSSAFLSAQGAGFGAQGKRPQPSTSNVLQQAPN